MSEKKLLELGPPEEHQERHTDDMQDIITKVPSWILRWGITLFSCVLIVIISLSALIKYPDIVKTQLKIISPNAAKAVIAKVSGKLVKLLVADNTMVIAGQPLAYLESTGNHAEICQMTKSLAGLQNQVLKSQPVNELFFLPADNTQLGELQPTYQVFYQEYLNYRSAINDGIYLKKKRFLENDLSDLQKQIRQLHLQKEIQQKSFSLADDDYEMHKKLTKEKVETIAEFRQQEGRYLAQKSPLVQTESALIAANNNYSAKQKEIVELENQIIEEKAKFLQSLNSLISQAEEWKSKYILTASQTGKLSYAGIIQENQVLRAAQEIFYINPGNEAFFGEMAIPQDNMGKVKEGQVVLVKLKSYPFEEYGMIWGRIKHIADIPYKDSVFVSKVDFSMKTRSDVSRPIHLKQGMIADAEIITLDATILQRISRSLFKLSAKSLD